MIPLITAVNIWICVGAATAFLFYLAVDRALAVDPLAPCRKCRRTRRETVNLLDDLPLDHPAILAFLLFLVGAVWPLALPSSLRILTHTCKQEKKKEETSV